MTDTTAALETISIDPRGSSRTRNSCASQHPALPVHAPTAGVRQSGFAEAMGSAGIEHVEVAETGGHPSYTATAHVAGAPTVLVYGTTTSSRSIRSMNGRRRRSSRSEGHRRHAARRTTRAASTST
jgi:hypothetical protein